MSPTPPVIFPWYTLVSIWAVALAATIVGLAVVGVVALMRRLRS